MSVLIKDMEKPKSCYAIIDGEFKYCPFVNTDDDCVLQLEKGICEGTWADQYSKCPLIEASEPCEDTISRKAAIDAVKHAWAKGLEPTQYIEDLPSAQPEIIRCKDCKHHGKRIPLELCSVLLHDARRWVLLMWRKERRWLNRQTGGD